MSIKTLILGTFAAFAFVAGIQAASANIVRSGCDPPTFSKDWGVAPSIAPANAVSARLVSAVALGDGGPKVGPASPLIVALGDSGTSGIEGDNGLDITKGDGLTALT